MNITRRQITNILKKEGIKISVYSPNGRIRGMGSSTEGIEVVAFPWTYIRNGRILNAYKDDRQEISLQWSGVMLDRTEAIEVMKKVAEALTKRGIQFSYPYEDKSQIDIFVSRYPDCV